MYYNNAAPNGYNVTFNLNGAGATGQPIPQNIPTGLTAIKPIPDPTRPGFHFWGWYTHATAGVLFDFDNTPITAATTLYARWNANPPYTITFDNGGGTGTMASVIVMGGSNYAIPANTFTNDDLLFDGWNATITGTSTPFGAGTYADLATITGVSGNITLTAKWKTAGQPLELPIYISAMKTVQVLGVDNVTITVKALPEAVGTTELFDLSFIGINDLLNPVGFAPLLIPGSFGGPYTVNQIRAGVTFTFPITPGNKMFFYRAVSKESN